MNSKDIVKEYVEKQWGYKDREILKSQWKCPICCKIMYHPELGEGEDMGDSTDICPIHGAFCIMHR